MNFAYDNYETSLDVLLREAGEHLNAGRKDEARELLRQALELDRNNLATWELLWKAAYTPEEELSSVRHILKIDPKNAAARKRLAALQKLGVMNPISQPLARKTGPRSGTRRKRQQTGTALLIFLGGLISVLCVTLTGLALYRGGYLSALFPSGTNATALADKNASCQMLIDRTIQASRNSCTNTGSNTACYGNNKLQAELTVNTTGQRFSERGDIIPVQNLQRLSASPLNLENDEWGIAVFKVLANLPRSLPGETVTMVVFGNATLDNQSGMSESLESFYFTSEVGQVVCEKIPFDGLMINSPDNSGIRLTINGTDLTLIGSASIHAIKNGNMDVNVYKGSARLVANGQEQYVGAGQSSSVQLGGENGAEAISGPSAPVPLEGQELTMACTMTGQYCSSSEVTPVSAEQAQSQIASAITLTPTVVPMATIAGTASPTVPPTFTLVVLPETLFPRTATATATATRLPTETRTRTPLPTNTPTITRTFTPIFTPTNTATPSFTPGAPVIGDCGPLIPTLLTNPASNQLNMEISNNSGGTIVIDRFFAYWPDVPSSQKISQLILNGTVAWNPSDPDSPTDIPTEGNWKNVDLSIPTGTVSNLLIDFSSDLQPTGYEIHVIFAHGCQVTQTR